MRAVRSVAAGLAERGFGRGDVLALCAPNTPEYAVAFHAVAALGGVLTTINPAYTAHEIRFQLENAGARLAVTAAGFEDRVKEAGAEDVLVLGEPRSTTCSRRIRTRRCPTRPTRRTSSRSRTRAARPACRRA